MPVPKIHLSTVLAVVTIIPGVLLASLFLLFGVANLINPDVPESALEENFRICVAVCLNAVVLIYALFRPYFGGLALCVCAVAVALMSFPLSVPFLALGVLSIIRGRIARRQGTASQ